MVVSSDTGTCKHNRTKTVGEREKERKRGKEWEKIKGKKMKKEENQSKESHAVVKR